MADRHRLDDWNSKRKGEKEWNDRNDFGLFDSCAVGQILWSQTHKNRFWRLLRNRHHRRRLTHYCLCKRIFLSFQCILLLLPLTGAYNSVWSCAKQRNEMQLRMPHMVFVFSVRFLVPFWAVLKTISQDGRRMVEMCMCVILRMKNPLHCNNRRLFNGQHMHIAKPAVLMAAVFLARSRYAILSHMVRRGREYLE